MKNLKPLGLLEKGSIFIWQDKVYTKEADVDELGVEVSGSDGVGRMPSERLVSLIGHLGKDVEGSPEWYRSLGEISK